MLRVITVVVAALVALSACSSDPVHPAPSPKAATPAASPTSSKPKVDLAHIRAKDVFGDFATVDACTLTSVAEVPASLRKHGTPTIEPGYETDTCELEATIGSHHPAYVLFGGLLSTQTASVLGATGKAEDVGGGLTVVRGESGPAFCYHYLRFADGISLIVDAATHGDTTKTELCSAGHDLTMGIASHLRAGKGVEHEIVRESSLRHRDACDFLTESQARSAPHMSDVSSSGSVPDRQLCMYDDAAGGFVQLEFVRVSADLSGFPDGPRTTIAGRPTARRHVSSDNGSTMCELITAYGKASTSGYADDTVEGFALAVRRFGSVESVCADVTALAKKVWPKLPKA